MESTEVELAEEVDYGFEELDYSQDMHSEEENLEEVSIEYALVV